jgi:predicted DNA-binding transcriptional regulator AlpA
VKETVANRPQDRLTRRMDTASNLLKPNDLERRLAVSRAWVYEAAKSGRIPSVRMAASTDRFGSSRRTSSDG